MKFPFNRLLLLILFFLFTQSLTFSQTIKFNKVTATEGQVSGIISGITQDAQGYIWFTSSGSGLNRYDGYLIPNERAPDSIILHSQQKMTLFTKDQSLISEYINSLAWDRKVKELSLNAMIAHRQLALRLIAFFSKE